MNHLVSGVAATGAIALAWLFTPVAHAQDNRADLAVKGDLRSLANSMETFYTDEASYPRSADVNYDGRRTVGIGPYSVHLHRNDRLGAIRLTDDGQSFCLRVVRDAGASETSRTWGYQSDNGGMRPGACPSRYRVIVWSSR